MAAERLQKLLAQAGVASRRAAEAYILDGRVKVNGHVVRELGSKADLGVDRIEVDGYGVLQREPHVYIAMHKPEHVMSTVRDPGGRPTVLDILQQSRAVGARSFEGKLPRLYPVGRLDFDAEGLILLTNDGELSNQLMHPRHHVPKTYLVKVKGRPDDKALERLRRGVRLREAHGGLSKRPTLPAQVTVYRHSSSNTWLELTIVEGRNHQVKRMCEAVGAWVLRLVRTQVGSIEVDPLPAGAWRFLSRAEVDSLRDWQPGQGGVPRPVPAQRPVVGPRRRAGTERNTVSSGRSSGGRSAVATGRSKSTGDIRETSHTGGGRRATPGTRGPTTGARGGKPATGARRAKRTPGTRRPTTGARGAKPATGARRAKSTPGTRKVGARRTNSTGPQRPARSQASRKRPPRGGAGPKRR